jgi:rare lipoprotein A (peptidoglycan hydrolase)
VKKKVKETMNIGAHKGLRRRLLAAAVVLLWLQGETAILGNEPEEKTEAVAKKVEQKAKHTEKAEGKQDLIKDKVRVKTNTQGEPVVEQFGEASYYGKGFHGKKTASGKTFNQNALIAAHPALPLGTDAKVTNLETGKAVKVKINDRGPHVKGRDIDLSKAAAQKIGMTKEGEAPVKIEVKVSSEDEKILTTDNDKEKK